MLLLVARELGLPRRLPRSVEQDDDVALVARMMGRPVADHADGRTVLEARADHHRLVLRAHTVLVGQRGRPDELRGQIGE